ncbi:MAG: hypothetical protein ACFB0C_24490 [Leptolyngbyaceae cyanobacterium]
MIKTRHQSWGVTPKLSQPPDPKLLCGISPPDPELRGGVQSLRSGASGPQA